MAREHKGETYLIGKEVMALWPASRTLFYKNIQSRLRTYHFDGKKRPHYYKKSEVLALRDGEVIARKDVVTISGIFTDWTVYLRSLGYKAETRSNAIEITTLPEEAYTSFSIPAEKQFVKRTRVTLANNVPICTWSTYYPLNLVDGEILSEMRQDPSLNVVKRIKEMDGVVVGWERNRYTARDATLAEQNVLELLTNEPVLILQRACWTRDKQILTHVSHMTLLGSWFAAEHEVPVNLWDDGLTVK